VFASIRNFRDAGGLQTASGRSTKTGLLYRSGDLADASPGDLQALSELGIRTIVDMRTLQEVERHPDRLPSAEVRYIQLPIKVSSHDDFGPFRQMISHLFGKGRNRDYSGVMVDSYREYVSRFQSTFARLFRLILEPGSLPLLVHCTAGKDRTGVSISLVQRALGVPEDTVMNNYLESNRAALLLQQTLEERYRMGAIFGFTFDQFSPLMEARTQYLRAAYDEISRICGTVETYLLQQVLLSRQELASVKNTLLNT